VGYAFAARIRGRFYLKVRDLVTFDVKTSVDFMYI